MMNNQNIEMLSNIFDALMTINVKGADMITLSNCVQALQNVINSEQQKAAAAAAPAGEPEDAE